MKGSVILRKGENEISNSTLDAGVHYRSHLPQPPQIPSLLHITQYQHKIGHVGFQDCHLRHPNKHLCVLTVRQALGQTLKTNTSLPRAQRRTSSLPPAPRANTAN